MSENELRIRKARVIPEDEIRFPEEVPIVLAEGNASGSCKRSIIRRSRMLRYGA